MNSNHLITLAHKAGVPIKKLSIQTMAIVNNAPQAQKRTAERKKPVKIVNDLVFKGPYSCRRRIHSCPTIYSWFPMLSFATLFDIYQNETFNKDLSEYLSRFVDALENKDEKKALYYAYIISLFLNQRSRLLTVILNKSVRRNEDLIQVWLAAYKKHDELLMFVGIVVLLCRDFSYTHGEYYDDIAQYLSIPIKSVRIPDRAYDKHTSAGKQKGRGVKHFFNKGTAVKNERFPNIWEESGKNAYFIADQKGLGKTAKMIDAINNKLRAPDTLETI